MNRLVVLSAVCLLMSSACTRESREPSVRTGVRDISDWVMLVPDWKNDVVHRISLDGDYEGDFLILDRSPDSEVPKRAWRSPRGIVPAPGKDGGYWLAAERGLSEWSARGEFRRLITADSTHLQDPAAIIRFGDEFFVVSQDKKAMLVFDPSGERTRRFISPDLDRATDGKLGPDGLLYVSKSLRSSEQPGLVSVWDPKNRSEEPTALRYLVPPELTENGTASVQSFAFDDDANLLIADHVRGRVERWSTRDNTKIEVLLEGGSLNQFKELERGPDGLVYLAGTRGIYRFIASASADELKGLTPFYSAETISEQYEHEFSPQAILFVERSQLGGS
jgi:sugar lactone lactonase YvrE